MHIFGHRKIHAEELLKQPNLRSYVKTAHKLASTHEAINVFEKDTRNFVKDGNGEFLGFSPAYFGAAIEFLAESFFLEFGGMFNLKFDRSVDDHESSEIDQGIDHYAKSLTQKYYKKTGVECVPGSPIYIQTKGTIHFGKEYKTNDGSRLPNFFAHAQGKARHERACYQARYILFTTGSKLHYILDNNTFGMTEVIGYKQISKLIDGNEQFFNTMRKRCDVQEVIIEPIDLEAKLISEKQDLIA